MFMANMGIWHMPKWPKSVIWAHTDMPKLTINIGLMGVYQERTKKLDLIWTSGYGFIENF